MTPPGSGRSLTGQTDRLLARARELGTPMTVTVVDEGGRLVLCARADHTGFFTPGIVVIFMLGFILDFIEITFVVVPIIGPALSPQEKALLLLLLELLLVLRLLLRVAIDSSSANGWRVTRQASPDHFAKRWEFLSAVWTNGPGLDPDGATGSGSGTDPNEGTTGDNGPGLDPNG